MQHDATGPSLGTPVRGDAVQGGAVHSYFSERGLWLVRLRWYAIAGVIGMILVAGRFEWITDARSMLVVAGIMALYNAFLLQGTRRQEDSGARDEHLIFLQIVFDLGALTLLLHWSGGIENPFVMLFALHMAISAMLLARWSAIALGLIAVLLHGGTLIAECIGLLPHHPLNLSAGWALDGTLTGEPWRAPWLVAGVIVALAMMLFGVIYFVRSVEEQRWRAEEKARARERIGLARERMARIGEISSGVAHTIRNPLHGVLNCLDILKGQSQGDAEASREVVDLMSEGLRRIQSVTERLLRLTREDRMERVPTDLSELVRESLTFLEPKAFKQGVKISFQPRDLPAVQVDPDRIAEAVINLVDNAIYACRGGGDVTLRVLLSEDAGDFACIEVEDTGSGISPEGLEHVFNPFYSTKGVGEGSGLGLAIVARVAEEHGGRVAVESTPGQGSCFRLCLPLAAARVSSGGMVH